MLKTCMISGVVEAGCDEAGRGPLAGSVFAAAVVLDETQCLMDERWGLLNDSKQLTEKQREELRPFIETHALAWEVVEVSAEEIDQINILQASLTGMRRALDGVSKQLSAKQMRLQHILVDGNKWRDYVPEGEVMAIPATTVVKGDGKYLSIAAASILAKTHRDEYMLKLANEYPGYGWEHNMGYPTAEHYKAIAELGITPYHRKSFRLTK